jgi:hypothetical protein
MTKKKKFNKIQTRLAVDSIWETSTWETLTDYSEDKDHQGSMSQNFYVCNLQMSVIR